MQSIFETLTPEEKEKILKISDRKTYKKGDMFVRENTPGEEFYILKSGKVIVTKKIADSSPPCFLAKARRGDESGLSGREGKEEKTLAILEGGDFFGEMSLLDGGPHSANVKALEDVEVITIKRELFEKMLKTDYRTASRFLFAVIKVISERLRSTSEELVALYETGKIIGSSTGLKDLLSQTLRLLMEVTGSPFGIFLLVNQFTGEMDVKESVGLDEIDKELSAELLKESLGVMVNNLQDNDRFKGKIKARVEISSFLASSLKVKEKPIGLILLAKESVVGFKREKLNLLVAVANQMATAVENAYLNEEAEARKKLRQVYIKY